MTITSLAKFIAGVKRMVVENVEIENPETNPTIIIRVRPAKRDSCRCGICGKKCSGYDKGNGRRRWRAMDIGNSCKVYLESDSPRVWCREHGVTVQMVPWARHGSKHTRGFEDSGGISSDFLRGVIDAALVKKGSLADKANNITWNMITGAFKGTNMEITTLTSETVNADSLKADQTDAGELTATSIETESVEADSINADIVGAQTVIAESVEATSVSADTLSSGDGFTGTFHIPGTADALGCTISIRDGIITGLVEDEPPEPEDPDPGEPVDPDPQEPDPSEEGE